MLIQFTTILQDQIIINSNYIVSVRFNKRPCEFKISQPGVYNNQPIKTVQSFVISLSNDKVINLGTLTTVTGYEPTYISEEHFKILSSNVDHIINELSKLGYKQSN